ncbi:hypothetical protein D3C80_1173610 [compost metagenome]
MHGLRGMPGEMLSVGRARWAQQHLHEPDEETVAADYHHRQQGKEAGDKEQEQTGFLAALGCLLLRHSINLLADLHRA